MKAAVFYAPLDVRVEDRPEPATGAGEVKLRIRNTSTCGTDVKIYKNGHQNMSPPQVMGHEIAGEIVEIGEGVSGWSVGDGVQVIAAVPCGKCEECRRGRMTVCPHQTSMGYQYPGGFAEYMVVPALVLEVDGLNRIPEGLSYAEASVAEPLACVLNGQELARVGEGDDVIVVGSGPIGCLHVRLARSRGARRVFLADLNESRLAQAADLVKPDDTICSGDVDIIKAVFESHRRERGRRRDHRGRRGGHAGAGSAVHRATGADQLLRRATEGQLGHRVRLEPGALPGAHDRRGERLQPGAQQGSSRPDRLGRRAGIGSDHPPAATHRRARRHWNRQRG